MQIKDVRIERDPMEKILSHSIKKLVAHQKLATFIKIHLEKYKDYLLCLDKDLDEKGKLLPKLERIRLLMLSRGAKQ